MLGAAFKKMLKDRLGERVRFDVPMAGQTSLRVGGPADAMAMPDNLNVLTELMGILKNTETPWFVLGGGTNLLVKDSGIRGVVISMKHGFTSIEPLTSYEGGAEIHAGAGARLGSLCRYAMENSLEGMSFAIGIPGTIGGAILMNAGTEKGSMESVLSAIEVLHLPDKPATVARQNLSFSYRGLVWGRSITEVSGCEPIVLGGRFKFSHGNNRELVEEAHAIQAERKKKQPAGFSAGCIFKNPSAETPAGYLIDKAGLKGMRIGDAQVSDVHANFIVNLHRASAADILRLMEIVREKVLQEFGVELEPEIRTVG